MACPTCQLSAGRRKQVVGPLQFAGLFALLDMLQHPAPRKHSGLTDCTCPA